MEPPSPDLPFTNWGTLPVVCRSRSIASFPGRSPHHSRMSARVTHNPLAKLCILRQPGATHALLQTWFSSSLSTKATLAKIMLDTCTLSRYVYCYICISRIPDCLVTQRKKTSWKGKFSFPFTFLRFRLS